MAKKIRVPIRRSSARLAGKWFDDECVRLGSLAGSFRPDTLHFLRSLSRRTGPEIVSIELDRAFAERFVLGWRIIFQRHNPTLLVQTRPHPEQLKDGVAAMAEIVSEIHSRLRRQRGHPRTDVDPLAYYRAHQKHKALPRTKGGAGIPDASLRTLAAQWGIDSKNTQHKLLKAGRAFDDEMAKLKEALPESAQLLFVLTDPMDVEKGGVACVAIPPDDKSVD